MSVRRGMMAVPAAATRRVARRRIRRLRSLQLALQLLDPLPVSPHDIPYMLDAVEVELQFVHLCQDVVVPADLGVGIVDEVSGRIVYRHGDDLRLLAQVVHLLLDVLHEPVEVAPKLREGAAVEEE